MVTNRLSSLVAPLTMNTSSVYGDVFRCVSQLFYDTFHSLEDHLLDPLNETDMFCLHYVFVPIINRCLQEFVESWNHHRLSTEGNRTPYQLHSTSLFPSPQSVADVSCVDISSDIRPGDHVEIPRSNFRCCSVLSELLVQSIDVIHCRGDLGVGAYKHTVALVGNCKEKRH